MKSSIRFLGIASTLALVLAGCTPAPVGGVANVTISPSTAQTVEVGDTISFNSTVTRVAGDTTTSTARTFVSTNPAVLTIDAATGVATGVSAGTAEVYARSTFDPTKMSSRVTVTVTNPTTTASVIYRLNAGGGAIAAGDGGVAWAADDASMWVCSTNATGGDVHAETTATDTTGVVNAAAETDIYLTERYCLNGDLAFTFADLAAGTYTVRVHLSETNRTAAGQRVLNFTAYAGATPPAAPQVEGVDVFAATGGQFKALVVDVEGVVVPEGATGIDATLTLLIENTVPEAFVRGIEIIKTN